jgi:2-oxoglutarate dehydrogenase E1 component
VLCSGKVYYDLLEQRRKNDQKDVAIVRIEQLYPFPHQAVQEALKPYAHVHDFVWCQEEPLNQGAWYCSQHHFREVIPFGASALCRPPGLRLSGGRVYVRSPETATRSGQ